MALAVRCYDSSDADSICFTPQSYDTDLEPPNMLVDSDDILVDAENEKDDVAIINPDSDAELPGLPRADDCM